MIFNLVIGVIIALQVPATEYVSPVSPTVNSTEYESHFNATEVAEGWKATPFSGVPVIGDVFAGFNFFWQMMGYMADGLPTLLDWICYSFITDANGQIAFWILANAIRAIQAALVVTFLIEFFSGRVITD